MEGQDLDHNSGGAGSNLSSPSSSSTPINPHGRPRLRSSPGLLSNQSNSSYQQYGNDTKGTLPRIETQNGLPVPRIQKRGAHSNGGEMPAKRQRSPSATPSSSPFRTFKITKSGFDPLDCRAAEEDEKNKCTVQTTMDIGITSCLHLLPETTMDRLTPRPTCAPSHEANFPIKKGGNEETVLPDALIPLSYKSIQTVAPDFIHPNTYKHDGIGSDPTTSAVTRCNYTAMQNGGAIDEYALDESEEEDMMRLLNDTKACVESHMPPSSLVDGWDQDSRYADEYDANLQYSSLSSTSTISNTEDNSTSKAEPSSHMQAQDLLDYDVDWDAVFAITDSIPKDPSLVGVREAVQLQTTHIKTETPQAAPCLVERETSLAPFVRPPFPDKVRDRSPVAGLSSSTVLRTCFRIGEMISQASRCFHQHQAVIFELYARVTYSSRESLTRTQHFQFIDLFKDQLPYPSGTLTGWRLGSLLDRQSQVFVNTNSPKLCWCLCKPKRDPQASSHWTFEMIGIRETNWAEIRYAKMMLCGGKDAGSEKVPVVTPNCGKTNQNGIETGA